MVAIIVKFLLMKGELQRKTRQIKCVAEESKRVKEKEREKGVLKEKAVVRERE